MERHSSFHEDSQSDDLTHQDNLSTHLSANDGSFTGQSFLLSDRRQRINYSSEVNEDAKSDDFWTEQNLERLVGINHREAYVLDDFGDTLTIQRRQSYDLVSEGSLDDFGRAYGLSRSQPNNFYSEFDIFDTEVEQMTEEQAKLEVARLKSTSSNDLEATLRRIEEILKKFPLLGGQGADEQLVSAGPLPISRPQGQTNLVDNNREYLPTVNPQTHYRYDSIDGIPSRMVSIVSTKEEEKVDTFNLQQITTWFKAEVDQEKLTLISQKTSQMPREIPSHLEAVKKINFKLSYLPVPLEDENVINGLQMFLQQLNQVEEIYLNFKSIVNEASIDTLQSQLLTFFRAIRLKSLNSLEVNCYWDQGNQTNCLLDLISGELFDLMFILKKICLNFKPLVPEKIFCNFLERLRFVEGNLISVKLNMSLDPFQEGAPRGLKMPNVKICELYLKALSDSSDTLINFVRESLTSMKQLEDLSIKLTVKECSIDSISKLFDTINSLKSTMTRLNVIIKQGKTDEDEEKKRLETLVEIAVGALDIKNLTKLKIGVASSKHFIKGSSQESILQLWESEKEKLNKKFIDL